MKFGLLFETQRAYEGNEVDWNTLYKETLDQCELADQMGFDNLWFVEHHFLTGFSGSPCPEDVSHASTTGASRSLELDGQGSLSQMGSETDRTRPVVVLQRDSINRAASTPSWWCP